MSKTLSMILIVLAVLVLVGGLFFAGILYARAGGFGPAMMFGYGWNNAGAYGPGMMGNGYANGNQSTYGPSMMGGRGGHGMMGAFGGNAASSNQAPLTVQQAQAAAEKYLANLNNSDLKVVEVMIFDNNAYVAVKETSSGIGAFELLVDPASQVAYPEHGPNMMWNVKYSGLNHQYMMGGRGGNGMMSGAGGMMGGWGLQNTVPGNVPAQMAVSQDQAIKNAQAYLDDNISGAKAADDPMQFYGYYTIDFEKDGKVAGMLSVNGYSGQVFLHTWHGAFIDEAAIQ